MMASEGRTVKSTQTHILEKPPSCIEFLPSNQDFFLVGTYYLDSGAGQEDTNDQATNLAQSRNGSLLLFKLEETNMYA